MRHYNDFLYTSEEDTLAHYGVLGMKWGIHKAKRYSRKAKKARASGNRKLSSQYSKKSKAIMDELSKSDTKKTIKHVSEEPWAKLLAQTLIFGPFGAVTYNEFRGEGFNRNDSYNYARSSEPMYHFRPNGPDPKNVMLYNYYSAFGKH